MSNGDAIAAVTRTLQNLLTKATANVTVLPLDKARDSVAADQLNLFLFAAPLAAAWRNSDPVGLRPGEAGVAPLPLVLHYVITAYGDDEAAAHLILGRAMRILHDHPMLGAQEIVDATAVDLPGSDLHLQPERIRLTPLPISTHDMFELWSGFSTNYRLSAAYEVSVVLVDSKLDKRTPLPVLSRGPDDRGPSAVAAAAAELTAVLPPVGAAVATLGSTVRLVGSNLTGPGTTVRFRNRRLSAPIDLSTDTGTAQESTVALPSGDPAHAKWAPGMYTVSVVSSPPNQPSWTSSEVPMGLGAKITVTPLAVSAGEVELTVTCLPRLRRGQHVQILLDKHLQEHQADPATITIDTPVDPTKSSTVTGTVHAVKAGSYVARLRVDGVDSDPVGYEGSPPRPRFDPSVAVVVT